MYRSSCSGVADSPPAAYPLPPASPEVDGCGAREDGVGDKPSGQALSFQLSAQSDSANDGIRFRLRWTVRRMSWRLGGRGALLLYYRSGPAWAWCWLRRL